MHSPDLPAAAGWIPTEGDHHGGDHLHQGRGEVGRVEASQDPHRGGADQGPRASARRGQGEGGAAQLKAAGALKERRGKLVARRDKIDADIKALDAELEALAPSAQVDELDAGTPEG